MDAALPKLEFHNAIRVVAEEDDVPTVRHLGHEPRQYGTNVVTQNGVVLEHQGRPLARETFAPDGAMRHRVADGSGGEFRAGRDDSVGNDRARVERGSDDRIKPLKA